MFTNPPAGRIRCANDSLKPLSIQHLVFGQFSSFRNTETETCLSHQCHRLLWTFTKSLNDTINESAGMKSFRLEPWLFLLFKTWRSNLTMDVTAKQWRHISSIAKGNLKFMESSGYIIHISVNLESPSRDCHFHPPRLISLPIRCTSGISCNLKTPTDAKCTEPEGPLTPGDPRCTTCLGLEGVCQVHPWPTRQIGSPRQVNQPYLG